MANHNFEELKLFITGPTKIRKEILEQGNLPVFGHRDIEAKKRIEPILSNLKKIAEVSDDYEVILIPGTGTNAMEAGIKSLVADDEKLLCLSIGAFGDLFYSIAKSNGKDVHHLKFLEGDAIDLNILENTLKTLNPKAVTITHNETSTGVKNDLVKVCNIIRKYNSIILVDGVSIFGGDRTCIEEAKIDYYCTATQKCLALPPGLGIAFVSKDAIAKAQTVKNRGVTTDIIKHVESARKHQTLNTTPTQLINQMYVQLNYILDEGIDARFKRHKEMQDITVDWAKQLPAGFELLAKTENLSPSLTCIKVPKEFDKNQVKELLRKEGYLFDTGYGKLDTPTIRIGHMGDITKEELVEYLDVLKQKIEGVFVR